MSQDIQTKINNMLDEIPDYLPDDNRRAHTISRHDARWLANMMLVITDSGSCNRGITEEQALILKKMTPETLTDLRNMVKERRRLLALAGAGIVTLLAAVGKLALDAMDWSFWTKLFARPAG